jgi:hypothetical protein
VATPAEPNDPQVEQAVIFLRRLADEDRGDREYTAVTLQYGHDGPVGLEFADTELNRQHGFPADQSQVPIRDAKVTVPLRLAVDVATLLRNLQDAEGEERRFVEVMKARERVSQHLHHYLPESLQKRFRQTFEIAPGIVAAGQFLAVTPDRTAGNDASRGVRGNARQDARAVPGASADAQMLSCACHPHAPWSFRPESCHGRQVAGWARGRVPTAAAAWFGASDRAPVKPYPDESSRTHPSTRVTGHRRDLGTSPAGVDGWTTQKPLLEGVAQVGWPLEACCQKRGFARATAALQALLDPQLAFRRT